MSAGEFNEGAVARWMRAHADEYESATELAEACADAFDVADEGGPLDDETHWIWDLALEAVS